MSGVDAAACWEPGDSAAGLLAMDFRQHQASGDCPNVRLLSVKGLLPAETLLDDSWTVVRRVMLDGGSDLIYAVRDDVRALVTCSPLASTVEIAAPEWKAVAAVADEIEPRLNPTAQAPPAHVGVRLWHKSDSIYSQRRTLQAPEWNEVRYLYPAAVATALDGLTTFCDDPRLGRLLLWHGPPGTGKTSAIRALLRAWEGRCEGQVVIDPESFFRYPGYMADLLASSKPDQWRMIIAEDCDHYLMTDSNGTSGGPLGQLLSLTDGLLGQGTNTLVLITTNMNIRRIHPALLRPGRCRSNVEFTNLSANEASQVTGQPGTESMSLAEAMEVVHTGKNPAGSVLQYGYV